MANLNKVMLIGRLGQDPEIRYTQSGSAVANFSIATNEFWTDKQGEKKEKTDWHNIVAWSKQADLVQSYLKKGSQVYIEGKIQNNDWEDQEGKKHYKTEIVVTSIQFLDSKITEKDGQPNYSTNSTEQTTSAEEIEFEKSNDTKKGEDYIKDDIPF